MAACKGGEKMSRERGNTQTFQKEPRLVIDGPEELGIMLVGEIMDGARKRESWTSFYRQ